jgi:hypothetical protein
MMISLDQITITRAEGPTADCITFVAHNWEDAEDWLYRSAQSAPSNGGYDKCDVTITFADGEAFKIRYDMVHPFAETWLDLATSIRLQWEFFAGRWLPAHMEDYPERADNYRRDMNIDVDAWARRCDTYSIPGLEPRIDL